MHSHTAAFWSRKWGYSHAVILCGGIVLVSVAVQLFAGKQPTLPQFPFNWIAAGCLILAAMSSGYLFRGNRAVKWVGGAKMATANMILAAVIIVISTLVALPETPPNFTREEFLDALARSSHLPHRLKVLLGDSPHSWPFAACILIAVINLSAAIGRRLNKITLSAAGFLILHGGILLSIVAATAGASQADRFSIVLYRGRKPLSSFPSPGGIRELPAAISLQEFKVDTYPPTLALFEDDGTRDGKVYYSDAWIEKGLVEELGGVRVEVLEYYPSGSYGDAPLAHVRATPPDGTLDSKGRISCGSVRHPRIMMEIGPSLVLLMTGPRPRNFTATVREERNSMFVDHSIEVNRPAAIGDWTLYLQGYDERMGSATEWATFSLVRDPMLPIIYVGFGLIILGTFWMLWVPLRKGRKREAGK